MKPDPHPCDGCQKNIVYGDYRPCLCGECLQKQQQKKEDLPTPTIIYSKVDTK